MLAVSERVIIMTGKQLVAVLILAPVAIVLGSHNADAFSVRYLVDALGYVGVVCYLFFQGHLDSAEEIYEQEHPEVVMQLGLAPSSSVSSVAGLETK